MEPPEVGDPAGHRILGLEPHTWRKTVVGGEVWVSSSTLELLHSFSPARRLEELQSGDSEAEVFILEAFTALDILLD